MKLLEHICWRSEDSYKHGPPAELGAEITISILLSVQTNRIVPSQAHQLLYERLEINCALTSWQWLSKFINFIVAIVTVWDRVWHGLLDFNEHLSLLSVINIIAVVIIIVIISRSNISSEHDAFRNPGILKIQRNYAKNTQKFAN